MYFAYVIVYFAKTSNYGLGVVFRSASSHVLMGEQHQRKPEFNKYDCGSYTVANLKNLERVTMSREEYV